MTGRIVGWSPSFGFIKPDDGSADVFFCGHSCDPRRQVYGLLRKGDRVTFEVTPDPKKPGRIMATAVMWEGCSEPAPQSIDARASWKGSQDEWRRKNREQLRARVLG